MNAHSAQQDRESSPAEQWDRDGARRAIDELFSFAHTYRSSKSYLELMHFIARFRAYSPFNAMLVHIQIHAPVSSLTAVGKYHRSNTQIGDLT